MITEDDIKTTEERSQRHAQAPMLIDAVRAKHDDDTLAELAADLDMWLQERCKEDDLGPYAAFAACYMFIDRHAEMDKGDGDD